MLIALAAGGLVTLLIAIFGGPAALDRPQALRERIEAHVSEPERAEQALEQVDAFESFLQDELQAREKILKALEAELRKPRASRETAETLLDQGIAHERQAAVQLLDLREQLKQSITPEEWGAVFELAPASSD